MLPIKDIKERFDYNDRYEILIYTDIVYKEELTFYAVYDKMEKMMLRTFLSKENAFEWLSKLFGE